MSDAAKTGNGTRQEWTPVRAAYADGYRDGQAESQLDPRYINPDEVTMAESTSYRRGYKDGRNGRPYHG